MTEIHIERKSSLERSAWGSNLGTKLEILVHVYNTVNTSAYGGVLFATDWCMVVEPYG